MFSRASTERRRAPRIPVQIPVILKTQETRTSLLTGNLNRGGLYLRTDQPARLKELIEPEVDLGDGGPPLDAVAVVRHRLTPDEALHLGNTPGMGVQWFGMAQRAKARWEAFADRLAAEHFAVEAQSIAPPADTEPLPYGMHDKVKRRARRYAAQFRVSLASAELLEECVTRDVSSGGMFLATEQVPALGTKIQVLLVHPETEQTFALNGEVVRINPPGVEPAGMAVRFENLPESRKADLETFVRSGAPDASGGDFLFEKDDDDDWFAEFA